MAITTVIKGPEALERSMAATLATYLPGELTAIWSAWASYDAADGISVPLTIPPAARFLAGQRDVVKEYPSLVVASETWKQRLSGAELWGSHDHNLLVVAYLGGDKQHILDIVTKRWAVGIWETLMKHQALDGTCAVTGVDPIDCGWTPPAEYRSKIGMGFMRMLGWSVVAHVEQGVSQG